MWYRVLMTRVTKIIYLSFYASDFFQKRYQQKQKHLVN